MVNGAKVALAVGAGYFLGRTRKMRFALMLAAAGLTGKFPTTPTALAAQGLKSLGATADVSQLSQQLRGEVLNAAKAAALAAATKQVDSLNDRLQGVTSAVGADEVLEDVGDMVGVGEPVRSVGRLGRRRSAERDEDLYDDEDQGYEEPLDVDEEDVDEEDREPDDADFDEDEDTRAFDEEDRDEEEPADDDRPVRSGRRATRQATGPRTSGRRSSRGAASDDGPPASRRATRTAAKSAPVRRGR